MAETRKQLESHSELTPINQKEATDATELESKNDIEAPKPGPDDPDPDPSDDAMAEIEYDPADDAMHVDFNEDQWLPCIPGLSLTMATIIFAIIGAGVGITIAVTDQDHEVTSTITRYYNVTNEPIDPSMSYENVKIQDANERNGTTYLDYMMEQTEIATYTETGEALSDDWKKIIAFPGTLWVNALKLLVLPLIILMMVILPSRVDEIGFIGKRAIPLYLFTSTMAAIQGTIWAWCLAPGKIGGDGGLDYGEKDVGGGNVTELDAFLNIFFNAIPKNIVTAMTDLTILGIIVFFLTVGILLRAPSVKQVERDSVLNFSRAILRCCMMAVVWIIWFTPIGMGSLVCIKLATTENLAHLGSALGFYVLTVLIGHSIHLFLFYPLLFFATTRGNGYKWFMKIYDAPLLAFATSSSAATLPRSLQVAKNAGVRQSIYQFILPLGAAINMDGTALGFPIQIALIAQLYGVPMDFGTVVVILILSVIVSVGTAPIPNAGMVYVTMLFEAAGMGELAGEGLAILFILDWFVDRIETAVNVTSDQYVAKIIDDISDLAQKKHVDIKCGCCLGPNSGYVKTDFVDHGNVEVDV